MEWGGSSLSLWTMYKFVWFDVVACEARHARGVWGHAPPGNFFFEIYAF